MLLSISTISSYLDLLLPLLTFGEHTEHDSSEQLLTLLLDKLRLLAGGLLGLLTGGDRGDRLLAAGEDGERRPLIGDNDRERLGGERARLADGERGERRKRGDG